MVVPRLVPIVFLALAATAAGAETKPAARCGLLFNDKAGDQVADPTGLGVPLGAGPASVDLKGGFFSEDDGRLTANIVVADLRPADAAGYSYDFRFSAGSKAHYVRAAVGGGGAVTYSHAGGATTGALYPGADGIVQIVVPAELAPPGTELSATAASVDHVSPFATSHADAAPDGGPTGKSYTAAVSCPLGMPQADLTPPEQLTSLPFAAHARTLGSARTAWRKRRLRFAVDARHKIDKVTAELRDSKGRVYGSGTLTRVEGTGTLSLRIRRKPRAGNYTLIAAGFVEGRRLGTLQGVRLRK